MIERGGSKRVRIFAAVIVFFYLSTGATGDDLRTWTSADGKFKTEARQVGANEKEVTLEKKSGERIKVPLAKLSEADRTYLSQPQTKRQSETQPSGSRFSEQSTVPTSTAEVLKWLHEPSIPSEWELKGEFEAPGSSVRTVAWQAGQRAGSWAIGPCDAQGRVPGRGLSGWNGWL